MERGPLKQTDIDLLAEIEADAGRGKPARTNAEYAQAIGCHDDTARCAMQRLKLRGLIRCEIENNRRRRILHVERNAWTAWTRYHADATAKKHIKCLTCPDHLLSEGNHHRICDRCKTRGGPPDFFRQPRRPTGTNPDPRS